MGQAGMLELEGGGAHALRGHLLLVALQPSVGVGQTVLEDALEAGFGVALLTAAALVVFEAAFAAAEAVFEQ